MSEQRLAYVELAPEGIAQMRAVEHYLNTASGLESRLLELVRLRISLLNGCEYCVALHTREAARRNETAERIAGVAEWRNSDLYTQRERSALAWAEAVTNIQDGHAPDVLYEAALEHFSEAELVNLTIAVASINGWNRVAIAFRAQVAPGAVKKAAGA